MLDFRMETFLAVCRHMNYTKAAAELNMTQPAVSQHIHFLENKYQCKLFEYSGKKLKMTEAGKFLQSSTITMKADELHLMKMMEQQAGAGRRLAFGATMTIGEYVMPLALERFLKTYPQTDICMEVADTRVLLEHLDSGEIEFALVEGFFQKQEYDFLVYTTEAFAAVCSPEYKFSREVKKVEDLLPERLIIREKGSGSRYVLEKYLEGKNLLFQDFSGLMEISNIGAIKRMTELGAGITFLYEETVEEELEKKTLRKIELEDFCLFHDFTFIWRKGSIYQSYYKEIFSLLHGDKQEKSEEKSGFLGHS